MTYILLIESSTRQCSVALACDGEVLASVISGADNDHASTITIFINEVMDSAGLAFKELNAVAVSHGPGSYTGLRIGLSTAKGICYAAGKPLICIGTLESIAWQMKTESPAISPDSLLCPMIDARRMEVYTCLYDLEMKVLEEPRAQIIDEHSFGALLEKQPVLFGGDGASKLKELLPPHGNARFYGGEAIHAASLCIPAFNRYRVGDFADLAYSEPFYLKEFRAGIPRVKGLR